MCARRLKTETANALPWLPIFRYEHLRYKHCFRLSITIGGADEGALFSLIIVIWKNFLWISSNIHILEKICFSKLYQIGQKILTKKDPTKFPCSFHFTYWNHQTLLIFRIHEPQNSFEFRTLHLIHKAFEFSISSYTSSAESERGSVFLIDKWDCILHLFHSILKIHDQIIQKQNKKII